MTPAVRIILLLLCLLPAAAGHADPLSVVVSIPPQKWLSDQIGGHHLQTTILIPPGQDPHTFEATPKQIAALAASDLYCTVGLPVEQRLRQVLANSAPHLHLMAMDAAVEKHPLADHQHQGHNDLDHETLDPHIWLAPANLIRMAQALCTTLSELDPDHATEYQSNLEQTSILLNALDSRLKRQLEPVAGQTFYVFHPAFGAFARAYDLHQEAVEIGGKSPGPRQLAALISQAQAEGVTTIFVQPQFDSKTAQAIAQGIQGQVVAMDALAEDVPANLTRMAQALTTAFAQTRP